MEKLGILIIGYKNVTGTNRLLHSLDAVDFLEDRDITLIFSIDYSGDDSVEKIANAYEWRYGTKVVKAHQTNMGLQKHIMSCGDYLNQYDLDALLVLEDDIYLSPAAYSYMKAAVSFYKDNPRVAGIAMYKHEFNINAKHPFIEYLDGGDTFFVQYAMSWGQVWLRKQWNDFAEWFRNNEWEKLDKRLLPQNILGWKNSWLKYHIMYCIDKDLYFVYPRNGLTTDFADPGSHNKTVNTSMQIRLDMVKRNWSFNNPEDTLAVYDAFFENRKIKDFLDLPDLTMDLYGIKNYADDAKYVVTRRVLPYKVLKSWGLYVRPIESNILLNIPGNEIFLYDIKTPAPIQQINNNDRYFEYDLKGLSVVTMQNVKYCTHKIISYVKAKLKK